MNISKRTSLILIHIIFFFLLSLGIFLSLFFVSRYKIRYALEVSSFVMEKDSLNSQVKLLKAENDKLKFFLKEYFPEDYINWKTFENKRLKYSFMYPASAIVDDSDSVNVIHIKSPTIEISITHFDSPFYHPPVGTDVKAWVLDKVSYDEVGDSFKISQISALHLITYKSSQVYASDDYLFIKDNQLYDIKIVHSKEPNWDVNYKFLKSISFN